MTLSIPDKPDSKKEKLQKDLATAAYTLSIYAKHRQWCRFANIINGKDEFKTNRSKTRKNSCHRKNHKTRSHGLHCICARSSTQIATMANSAQRGRSFISGATATHTEYHENEKNNKNKNDCGCYNNNRYTVNNCNYPNDNNSTTCYFSRSIGR